MMSVPLQRGILLDYTLIEVYEGPLKRTMAVSRLDGLARSIYECRFDLDKVAEPATVITAVIDPNNPPKPPEAETITVHHHPQGDILKKSSQGSLSVGEYNFID